MYNVVVTSVRTIGRDKCILNYSRFTSVLGAKSVIVRLSCGWIDETCSGWGPMVHAVPERYCFNWRNLQKGLTLS